MSSNGLTETTLRGTAIGLMVVTTAMVFARAILRSDQKKSIQWDEIWLIVGYMLFMAITGVYINKTSLLFRLLAVEEGRLAPYPSVSKDGFDAQKTFFFTSPGLWLTLWSIKFSLLAFYKRIMVGVKLYEVLAASPRLKSEQLARLAEDKAVDIAAARADLGFTPRSFAEGIWAEAAMLA